MKQDYLYSVEDLTRYFVNSFVMLDGDIVQVRSVQWDAGAGNEAPDGKTLWPAILRVQYKDKGKYLDKAKAFKHIDEIMGACGKIPRCFGYLNFKYTCNYLSRSPERTAIKGLQPARLVRAGDNGLYSAHEFGLLGEHDIVDKLCNERFPSFQEAFDRVCNEQALGVAWHPDWALVWNTASGFPVLHYRGLLVGMAHTRNPRDIMLHSRAVQLQEAFEEGKRGVI